jgi:membrane protein YqaA with SNARE-associated domain
MFTVLRKLYNWVLHWAETPYGLFALFILSFSEASFFPVPPDVLLIVLILGRREQALKFAVICSIASIAGGFVGYSIGHFIWWDGTNYNSFANFFFNNIPGFTEALFQKIQNQYNNYGFIIIFTAGFTPIPFKVFTISAGAFDISLPLFLIASTISRSARFFLVSFLIWKYGEKINYFIDRYFNILSILFVIILFGSYFLINFIFVN